MHSDNKPLDGALQRGLAAHQAGRFMQALVEYRAALAAAPDDAELASLTGLALVHCGRPEEAIPFLNQAVTSEPNEPGLRFNLVEGLIAMRDLVRAQTELNVLLQNQPDCPRLWERIGDVAMLCRDRDGAARAWRRSLDVGLGLPPALKLARLELSLSHFDAAQLVLSRLTTHFADDPSVLALRRDCLIARRDWAALETLAVAWTQSTRDNRDAWRALARAAFEQGRYLDAVEAFGRVVAGPAPSADDLASLAGLQLHALDFEAAAATLARAAALVPEHPGMLARQALLHMYFGHFEAAADCSRRCLARDPENVTAYATLSRIQRGRLSNDELAILERIIREVGAPPDSRIPAAFLLAHAEDARGEFDAAFAAYLNAQSLALERDLTEGRRYEIAASEARFEHLVRLQAPAAPAVALAPAAPRPIFIVGMPRSGTTLVECVLGAHSRVLACGERPAMRHLLRAALESDTAGRRDEPAKMRTWIAYYLRDLPALCGADYFTDKNPLNFEAVGLIARLFPSAVIIHIRRNPIETGLSIFRQDFGKPWTFAHRLKDIGHFYGLQAKLMHHWERLLPGRITTIQYEEFAADLARGARQLVESIGLPWEPQCLDFQSAGRAIATFSTIEAREPVVVRNRHAARYVQHLAPLIAALTAAGIDLATGTFCGEGRVDDPAAG